MGAVRVVLAVLLVLLLPTAADAARMPRPAQYVIHQGEPTPEGCGEEACSIPQLGEVWLVGQPKSWIERFALSHEIGHVFFFQTATDSDRAYITRLLRFPDGTPWYASDEWYAASGESDSPPPDEIAADAYAACDLGLAPVLPPGRRSMRWIEGYGYAPTMRQHRRICLAIQFIGWYRGLPVER